MMRLMLSALLLAGLVFAAPGARAVECGEETCPAGAMCIDRGNGERCWSLCRVSLDCESACCRQIRYPFTAWICADTEECYPDPDGDDTPDGDPTHPDGDGEALEDGDAETETPRPEEPEPCAGRLCSSVERCAVFGDREPECTPVCRRAFDCTSECCVVGYASTAVCMPLDMECPRDKRVKVDPACSGAGAAPSVWLLLGGLWLFRRLRAGGPRP